MRTIGIIGAMEEEISFLREKMDIVTTKSVVGLTYYVGRYEGNNVVLVKSGIGKVNAAENMCMAPPCHTFVRLPVIIVKGCIYPHICFLKKHWKFRYIFKTKAFLQMPVR